MDFETYAVLRKKINSDASTAAGRAESAADRAEAALSVFGSIIDMEIIDGDLILSRQSDSGIDFEIVNGDLIMEAV